MLSIYQILTTFSIAQTNGTALYRAPVGAVIVGEDGARIGIRIGDLTICRCAISEFGAAYVTEEELFRAYWPGGERGSLTVDHSSLAWR